MKNFPKKLKHGSGVALVLEEGRLLVSLKRAWTPRQATRAVRKAGFVPEAVTRGLRRDEGPQEPRVNESTSRFWIQLEEGAAISDAQLASLRREIATDVEFVAPVYRIEGSEGDEGLVTPLPHVLLIRPKDGIGEASLAKLLASLARMGLEEQPERSKYLRPYRYFRAADPEVENAYSLQRRILRQHRAQVADVKFENMPVVKPLTFVPNDTLFGQQWNLQQIDAPDAWDIVTGEPAIVVAVLDEGCDLTHPDLVYASNGINLGSMAGTGAPTGEHGTACAGIIAAVLNNNAGVAGLAGGCRILPIAFQDWTDAECAAGIRYAIDQGAHVISMSFGVYGPGEDGWPTFGWDIGTVEPAIAEAAAAGLLLCAATGNEDIGTYNRYPARDASVMACGGSGTDDNRKSNASPDNECWGSNYADGVSVVAPCVNVPTTDIQGAGGYNTNNGGAKFWSCVNYASCGDAAGDYVTIFNGTSAATPHVAALGALVMSANPLVASNGVQDLIEQSTDKVGTVAYAAVSGYPNGTRNQHMGYGRINAHATVEAAALLFVHQFNQLFNG